MITQSLIDPACLAHCPVCPLCNKQTVKLNWSPIDTLSSNTPPIKLIPFECNTLIYDQIDGIIPDVIPGSHFSRFWTTIIAKEPPLYAFIDDNGCATFKLKSKKSKRLKDNILIQNINNLNDIPIIFNRLKKLIAFL